MGKKNQTGLKKLEIVEPIGSRVLIRKDEDKKQTKGGIRLPDNIEIPTITGRVVAISAEIENTPDIPLRQYDKVLFNPKGAIPVDFEGDNRLFVVEVENVVAVFRKSKTSLLVDSHRILSGRFRSRRLSLCLRWQLLP